MEEAEDGGHVLANGNANEEAGEQEAGSEVEEEEEAGDGDEEDGDEDGEDNDGDAEKRKAEEGDNTAVKDKLKSRMP